MDDTVFSQTSNDEPVERPASVTSVSRLESGFLFELTFSIGIYDYAGKQKPTTRLPRLTVKANSVGDFKKQIWEKAVPYIKSHTKVETVPNDTGEPPKTRILLDPERALTLESCQAQFFRVSEKKQKRYFALDNIHEKMLGRWTSLPAGRLTGNPRLPVRSRDCS